MTSWWRRILKFSLFAEAAMREAVTTRLEPIVDDIANQPGGGDIKTAATMTLADTYTNRALPWEFQVSLSD